MKLVLVALVYFTNTVTSEICYWNSECVYKYFSGNTPYDYVRGDIRDSRVKLKGCEPISIWTIIRHGKRNPENKYAKNMLAALVLRDYIARSYKNGNSSLCAQDVENLSNWKDDTDLFNNIHGLTNEGYLEIYGIGRRLKEAFRDFLKDLKDGSYTLRSAYGHWVEDGVDGFVKGLSNKTLLVEKPNRQYDVMAPYQACSKYFSHSTPGSTTYKEADKYQTTPEYILMEEKIQKRTGISYVLTDRNITSLYDLCRYTCSAIDNKGSPWCALFTKEDLQILEYYEDLRLYYRNGYGTPINEKFGQIPMADLYKTFLNVKKGKHRKLTANFCHATMMDMVYNALGWFKDDIPLSSEYRDPYRKWRSSKLTPFAGNLIAILNRCSRKDIEEYKIVFYSNEKLVTSTCDNGVCSWQEFENKFRPYTNTTMDFCFE